jgi:hypothetical protein
LSTTSALRREPRLRIGYCQQFERDASLKWVIF